MWHLYRVFVKFFRRKDLVYYASKLRDLFYYASHRLAPPFRLQIEPVSFCNLHCTFCVLSTMRRERKLLSLDHIKKIIIESGSRWIQLSGVGETFLHPDIIPIMVYIKSQKKILKITTNGQPLSRELCRAVVDAGVDYIDVSIDTTDSDLYKDIRGADFSKIIENVTYLREYRDLKKSSLVIGAKHVYNHKNIHHLTKDIERLTHLPFDDAFFLWIFDMYEGSSSGSILTAYLPIIREALKKAQRLGRPDLVRTVKILLENHRFLTGNKKNKVCFEPIYAPYITVDGDMIACCKCSMWVLQSEKNLQSMLMGNVIKEPFNDVWNGKRARQLRRNVLENRGNFAMCKTCAFDQHALFKMVSSWSRRLSLNKAKGVHAEKL